MCVLPVVDVSGSMQGAKLHYAKQSVMKLVDHLAPGDSCGVVTFTDEVATLAPPTEMTQPREDALDAAVGPRSTYAREVGVEVRPATGVALTEVLSDVDADEDAGAVRIRIPDLPSEEVRHLVIAVRLDAVAAPGRMPVALLTGRYAVVDPDTRGTRGSKHAAAVKVLEEAGVQLSTGAQDAMAEELQEKKSGPKQKAQRPPGLARERSKRW